MPPFARRGSCLVTLWLFASALLTPGPAAAQVVATVVDTLLITGLSDDGTVACGNTADGLYEAARWTATDGMVRLGRSSVRALGRGAGIPEISRDGLSVSSSIVSSDSVVTQGIWTKGIGWVESMPPVPPDGGSLDESYGSAWGLSGDGSSVVGLYWRPQSSDGTAHASKWNANSGLIDLGSQGRDSRANGADFDGSVVVGWSASPTISVWQPTVWDESGLTVLSETILWCEATKCNDAGNIVVGDAVDTLSYALPMQTAALWVRNGASWDEYLLGVLPGTFANGSGFARGLDVSEDGSIVVGMNSYDTWNQTGFVWTLEEGMAKADDWFDARGVVFPPDFTVLEVTSVTPDGTVLGGWGRNAAVFGSPLQGFIVDLNVSTSRAPAPRAASVTLRQNVPNPFNPSTVIELDLAEAGPLRLEVFDVRGRLVRVLHDGPLGVGEHSFPWNGTDGSGQSVASGTYFARVTGRQGDGDSISMTLLK